MARYRVPSTAFEQSLKLAQLVEANKLKTPAAERALIELYPEMSPRAAKGYIGGYLAMRRGTKDFGTTIAAGAWHFYLGAIAKDGPGPLSVALDAFLSHIIHAKSESDGTALRDVYDEYEEHLKRLVVSDALFPDLEQAVNEALKAPSHVRQGRLSRAPKKPEQVVVFARVFRRNPDVIAEVLLRANGICEGCFKPAPFARPDGRPFLEVHHRQRLADGGDDTVENAIALCPNCHRERHHGRDYASDATAPPSDNASFDASIQTTPLSKARNYL